MKCFKVNNVILTNLKDNKLYEELLEYNAKFIGIDAENNSIFNQNENFEIFIGRPLDILSDLKNFDAIFIDDDPNWYTVYNELNIIKRNNDEFPLVFICNNKFPNKRRDTYFNPDLIPEEFKNDFRNELPICFNDKKIFISDGYCHACEENTNKNGVFTAIEDFLSENKQIDIMKINFIDEITILYPKSSISDIRLSLLNENLEGHELNNYYFSDKISENNILLNYIEEYGISLNELETISTLKSEISKKENTIDEYINQLQIQDLELEYKDNQIKNIQTKLDLKNSQIDNYKSKLFNKDRIIQINEKKMLDKDNLIKRNEAELIDKDNLIKRNEAELIDKDNLIKRNEAELIDKDNLIKRNEAELIDKDNLIKRNEAELIDKDNLIKRNEAELIDKDNLIKRNEAELIDKDNLIKRNEAELIDKDNLIKRNEAELLNTERIINSHEKKLQEEKQNHDSLKQQYYIKLSEIDNKKYCISCYKEEISNNHLEIEYLKNSDKLSKKLMSFLEYLVLIFKSQPNEIIINFKLFKLIKNSRCFDIGYYLNNNKDIQNSKWCKYFSPELHYICFGFSEKRKFNKKYFNTSSKEQLLNYILNCND